MTALRVSVLTPSGQGALAVLAVAGRGAGLLLQRVFRSARGAELNLDEHAPRFWFGRVGGACGDEVILVRHSVDSFELHCHGGRCVVEWIVKLLAETGAIEVDRRPGGAGYADPAAAALLPYARTLRTASILLDQACGAYVRALSDPNAATTLRRNAMVGRHLVEPWRVAIAGAPNAGKSTLLNALAGFTRSIVSPIPGTTRDVVGVSLAFAGWPIDVVDTAGLRAPAEQLEEEGIRRAGEAVRCSDLVVWVVDVTLSPTPKPEEIAVLLNVPPDRLIVVLNKIDLVNEQPGPLRICAKMGAGLESLIATMTATLVPSPPQPGEPVPYTPALADLWS